MKPQQLKQGKSPVELGTPIQTISLDLTERCTLRCKYCFADHGFDQNTCKTEDTSKDLTFETGKQVIDWFLRDDVSGPAPKDLEAMNSHLVIDFWGGEPLMKFELLQQLVVYADEEANKVGKKFRFGGTTNVTLLNEDKLAWLLPRDIHFLLSIDGIGERNSERIFPDGSSSWPIIEKRLQDVVKMYKNFNKHLPGIRMTPTPGNIIGMFENIKTFYEMGFDSIFFSENYDADWTDQDLQDYKKELEQLADFRIQLLAKKERFLGSKFLDDNGRFVLQRGILGKPTPNNPSGRACGAGSNFMGVSVEGAIYICHRTNKHNTLDVEWHEKKFCLGSIFENITNEELYYELNDLKTPTFLGAQSPLMHCKDCPIEMLCLGGCYAVKYDNDGVLTGTIDGKICKIKMLLYELAFYEIMNAIKFGVLYHYSGMLGVKGFYSTFNGDGAAMNCACNMSNYASIPDLIDDIVRRQLYGSLATDEMKDQLSLMMMIRAMVDQEMKNITNAQDMKACICNMGAFNRDQLLSTIKLEDSQKKSLAEMFFLYWENK